MRNRICAAVLALAGTATMTAVAAPSAGADPTVPHLVGAGAGLTVNGLNRALSSGQIAASSLNTLTGRQHVSRTVASENLPGVATLGALASDETSTGTAATSLTMTSHAHTSDINLLGGVVTADAADTTATATYARGNTSFSSHTTFANLKIAGTPVSASTAQNTTITVPGVATVIVNFRAGTKSGNTGTIGAAALVVKLLTGVPAVTVQVSPVRAAVVQSGPGYAPLGGFTYGARAQLASGQNSVLSAGPLPLVVQPQEGTHGTDVSRTVASLNLGQAASLGAVTATVNGIATDLESRSTTSTHIANVNLFGGAITADAVTAQAQVDLQAGGAPVPTESIQLTNLVIGGRAIPANTAPNTVIPLAGIGKVIVNYQHSTANSADARALIIRLGGSAFGLPAGTTVMVGAANATFTP